MSELINITLSSISEPQSELSLMHRKFTESVSIVFYMNDLFSDHFNFESQFIFLWDQFFSQIEWVKLILFFKKFWLFVNHVKALRIKHYVSEKIHVLSKQVKTIIKWPELTNIKGVHGFLKIISITHQWVKNFTEIVWSLNWLTESVSWR